MLIKAGKERVKKVIDSSKTRGDSIHEWLEKELEGNPEIPIQCRKSHVSLYTSLTYIKRHLKRQSVSEEKTDATTCSFVAKCTRQSNSRATFSFQEDLVSVFVVVFLKWYSRTLL